MIAQKAKIYSNLATLIPTFLNLIHSFATFCQDVWRLRGKMTTADSEYGFSDCPAISVTR
jgi:hypothetical protein